MFRSGESTPAVRNDDPQIWMNGSQLFKAWGCFETPRTFIRVFATHLGYRLQGTARDFRSFNAHVRMNSVTETKRSRATLNASSLDKVVTKTTFLSP